MKNQRKIFKQGLWFSVFNSIFLLLIATRYFRYFYDNSDFLTIFYLVIATLSHFITLSFLAYLILYIPLLWVFPYKNFAWIWAAIISITSAITLFLDTFVYQLYRFHINPFVLELLFGGAGGQIFQFHYKQYLLVICVSIIFSVFVFASAYIFFRSPIFLKLKNGLWVIATTVVMILSSHLIHVWADAINYIPITKSSRYYPLYFPTTARTLMLNMGLIDSLQVANNRLRYNTPRGAGLDYPKNPIELDEKATMDIVMIIIDSWRYSTLDSLNMPNLYNFSQKCEVYQHHYSGSNGTRTGIFSLFYSIPGIYWDAVLASRTSPVFIDALLRNNYQIKTFPSASLLSPPFDLTVFRKIKDLNIETKGSSAHARDRQITHDWLSMSQKLANDTHSSTFSFLFYDALHAISHPSDFKGPYQPEWEYAKYELLNNAIDPTPFLNLYKNTAYYLDSLVGLVLNDLEDRGALEHSWVIISGDHGQEFNDNKKNYWGHNGNYTAAQMQVPLLVYKPNTPHKTYTHWTSHYDIVPTVFKDLFQSKNKISDYSIGKHLNDTTPRNWLLVGSTDNFAIIQPNRITSVYFDGTFDITDSKLQRIENTTLDLTFFNQIMTSSKTFYSQ